MKQHVAVVVLGDLGRSPRIQYHAASILKAFPSLHVTLIGYEGEPLIPLLKSQQATNSENFLEVRISLKNIFSESLVFLRGIPFLHAFMKGVLLLIQLLYILWIIPSYELVIIQNPPCLPVLFAATIIKFARMIFRFNGAGNRIMIDWHNLGFKMFEERLGAKSLLVKVAKLLEIKMCALADFHICVSEALQSWLQINCSHIKATVFHDKPSTLFKADHSLEEVHALLKKLNFVERNLFTGWEGDCSVSSTIQTTEMNTLCNDGNHRTEVISRSDKNRTAVLISSTSWTADEDFGLLLDSLIAVDESLVAYFDDNRDSDESTTSCIFSRLLVVVTGKGPLKQSFEQRIADATAAGRLGRRVAVRTVWLEPHEYPILMSCADLGVCLHTSTSGLDLPMKVLDMFGSGVPVLAVYFPTLVELVRHGENGIIFHDSVELTQSIVRLLFPKDQFPNVTGNRFAESPLKELTRLKEATSRVENWDVNWDRIMRPIVQDILSATSD